MAAAIPAILMPWPALAGALDAGDLPIRWDNTLRLATVFRLDGRDPRLLAAINGDDGDRNFAPGLVSDRLDLYSELDLGRQSLGLRLSGAGWVDGAYLGDTDDRSAATFNGAGVSVGRFPGATRRLHGLDADLLDAFVHADVTLAGVPVTLRLGRHTLIWGESLFFARNGIAGGQAPVDAIKALSSPGATAKELFLPVAQLSAVLEPRPGLAVSAYVQPEWRPDRLPGAGSYFSTSDVLDAGGERLLLAGGGALRRSADTRPGAGLQYGAAVTASLDAVDLGFYALRFDAKSPTVVARPCGCAAGGGYWLAYPRGTTLVGASASGSWGDANIAGEISWRHRAVLASQPVTVAAAGVPTYQGIARGDTLHEQLSLVTAPTPGRLWDQATLSLELAANQVLAVTEDAQALAPGSTRSAAAIEATWALSYFRVLPGLDLTPALNLEWGLYGRSPADAELTGNAGDLTLGLDATFRAVWHAGIAYTRYLGRPDRQPLADRDFVAVSVARTF